MGRHHHVTELALGALARFCRPTDEKPGPEREHLGEGPRHPLSYCTRFGEADASFRVAQPDTAAFALGHPHPVSCAGLSDALEETPVPTRSAHACAPEVGPRRATGINLRTRVSAFHPPGDGSETLRADGDEGRHGNTLL